MRVTFNSGITHRRRTGSFPGYVPIHPQWGSCPASDHLYLRLWILSVSAFMLAPGTAARCGDENSPYKFGTVTIVQRPVFDDTDTTIIGTLGRIANDVHVMTNPDVVRRELLFREGDPYDQSLVDESARHLRALNFVGDIRIINDTLPDYTINITVSSRDRWSLRPDMSVRQGGGVTGFGVGLREDNLFGGGQKLSVGYDRLSNQPHPNGGVVAFTEPRLFGSWWMTTVQYGSSDVLSQTSLDIERPFFADSATWATRGFAGTGRIGIRQYANGEIAREDYINQENELAWVASSIGGATKLQLAAAYVRTRSSADTFQLRPFDNMDLAIGAISIFHREYYRANHLENFGRVEDVPVGYQVGIAAGRNLHCSSAGSVDYFVRVFGQGTISDGDDFYGGYQATLSSYLVGREADEMTLNATALQHWRWAPMQTLLARVTSTIGFHWAPSSQLTLGSFSGLRGYRNYDLVGQRLFLVNLEDRAFSALKIWFLRFGGSVFFDSGVVWEDGGLRGQRFHSAVGFGLTIESGKNLGSGIFRVDIAYNLDRRSIGLSLSSDHLFRAFSDMQFIPPIPDAATTADSRRSRD